MFNVLVSYPNGYYTTVRVTAKNARDAYSLAKLFRPHAQIVWISARYEA
jgi:hypothetical protein